MTRKEGSAGIGPPEDPRVTRKEGQKRKRRGEQEKKGWKWRKSVIKSDKEKELSRWMRLPFEALFGHQLMQSHRHLAKTINLGSRDSSSMDHTSS